MPAPELRRATVAILIAAVAVRFAVAATAPITRDEAYYLAWSRALDLGYFDHPPAVAWLGATTFLAPGSALAGRLGALAVTALATPFCAGLFRRIGLGERRAFVAAMLLATFSVPGIASGMLILPDALLFVAWCAALHEAAAAIDGSPRRWLTAGLAVGVGLLSKYMMVLAVPVLLYGAFAGRSRQLRTIWPWAGALVALAVFSPHLVWNARNEWVPMRFQLEHGFASERAVEASTSGALPRPGAPGEAELALARHFGYGEQAGARVPERPVDSGPTTLETTSGYAGGLLALWGFLVLVVGIAAYERLRGRAAPEIAIRPHLRPLIGAAALVPIAFFAVASLRTRVEANWPAVYVVGASAFLASAGARRPRTTLVCAAANVAVLILGAVHARAPLFAGASDRVMKETRGNRELAGAVALTEGPVFFDRHQTGGVLRFHLPDRDFAQWPGLARTSEFERRPEWSAMGAAELALVDSFWLVTEQRVPPALGGFRPVSLREIAACAGAVRVRSFPPDPADTAASDCDGEPVFRRWSLIEYVAVDQESPAGK